MVRGLAADALATVWLVFGVCAAAIGAVVATLPTETRALDRGPVRIDGGTFRMGSETHYREEGRVRQVTVGPFTIGRTEVTNAEFAEFVAATGYLTTAERALDPQAHPGMPEELLQPGSMVFAQPAEAVALGDPTAWWRFVPGANWRHPTGAASSIDGLDNHPVVQVSPEDAAAYAAWAGGRLPTEAEWEFAARGGSEATWDEPYNPAEGWKANTWQGAFPSRDLAEDGHHGTAPVASFPANGYGLHDMTGNVWEHVSDWWVPGHPEAEETDPVGPPEQLAARFSHPQIGPMRVVKGGSWLCAPSYCMRYRPSARQSAELGLGSNHIGFRLARDAE
jgi:formylglycine-generating enzyme required for sulfatase activity